MSKRNVFKSLWNLDEILSNAIKFIKKKYINRVASVQVYCLTLNIIILNQIFTKCKGKIK